MKIELLPLYIKLYDDFSDAQARGEISFNHGIHGVMDMCNLLKRSSKEYAIAAGHIEESDVLERTLGFVRAAQAARELCGMKVGTIGGSFDGMGDFIVTDGELKDSFGVDVVDEALENTARCALAVRNRIDKYALGAFTVNFLKIGAESGLDVMPFIEACKQLSRGVGYAGEGDVLTASVVGALIKHFAETSFIEIFCPDWKNDRVFISHMGEMKPRRPTILLALSEAGFARYARRLNSLSGSVTLELHITVHSSTARS